jgi:hypothetical protein
MSPSLLWYEARIVLNFSFEKYKPNVFIKPLKNDIFAFRSGQIRFGITANGNIDKS